MRKQLLQGMEKMFLPHADALRGLLLSRARITIYTAIFGPIDGLLQPLQGKKRKGLRFVCFTDQPVAEPGIWEIRSAVRTQASSRMTARWHKLNAHLALPDTDYSLYMDGTFRLNLDPVCALTWFLGRHSIAMMKHPDRDCIFDEIQACIRYRKDDANILEAQAAAYRAEGYPAQHGLVASGVMLRRHDERTRRSNEAWWQELQAHSQRDQCSFNYVLHRLGLDFHPIPGSIWTNPFFPYTPHVQGIPPQRTQATTPP